MNQTLPRADDALLGIGFAEPVFEAQAWFRRLMDAMARPARAVETRPPESPPEPLAPIAAGLLLTLCDDDTPVWLAPSLRESRWSATWLRFHTGAPIVDAPERAAFVVAGGSSECPAFDAIARGSDEYPDGGATVLLPVDAFGEGEPLTFEGPGIDGRATLAVAGLPADFAARWRANRAGFPRGVELILVTDHAFACLPRSLSLVER